MKHPDDHQIWRQFLAGDTQAFSALFLKYHPLLLHYGIKLCQDETLAEECAQDLFCYLFENKGKLSEIRQVKAYLFVSFRRRILRMQQGKRMMALEETTATDTDIQFSQEELIIDRERQTSEQKILWQMLNELPGRQREVVYLKYYQGLEADEIAVAMHITHQGVFNALYKAFKNLRKTAKKDFKSSFYYFLFF
jgi:RNA polymerase sigma factor (sigma-70 family)